MKERFEGEEGRRRLVEVLKSQKMVNGNEALATDLAQLVELVDVEPGEKIIAQGDESIDIFLILMGRFTIEINGQLIAQRVPGDHLGEMAAIQPTQKRSANVVAAEKSVVAKFSEAQLNQLGDKYVGVWRCLAKEMAIRLEQRNVHVPVKRARPRVFIMSSVEGLEIARAVKGAFEHDNFDKKVWIHGTFLASHYPLESLEEELGKSDFAIAIGTPDDLVTSRGKTSPALRDNVVFELGFFMGRLGRHRTVLLEPRGESAILPSDLKGITTLTYTYKEGDDLDAAVDTPCDQIRRLIAQYGPL